MKGWRCQEVHLLQDRLCARRSHPGTKFGASPPSLTAENPVVFSEHHHPKTLKTL